MHTPVAYLGILEHSGDVANVGHNVTLLFNTWDFCNALTMQSFSRYFLSPFCNTCRSENGVSNPGVCLSHLIHFMIFKEFITA